MKRSWEIKNGELPDALRSEFEDITHPNSPFDTEG